MLPIKQKINPFGIFFFLLTLLSFSAQAQEAPKAPPKPSNQDCFSCHADNAPLIDQKTFNNSVHQSLDCVDCHKDISDLPHADQLKKVDCSICHDKESKLWLTSDHAKAMVAGASLTSSCSNCHGSPHAMQLMIHLHLLIAKIFQRLVQIVIKKNKVC